MRVISEGPVKITKTGIEAAWRRRAPEQRLTIRDSECRGLTLIVNATTLRWEYAYRPRGTDPVTGRRWPNQAVTIGNPATHSPEDARTEANRIKGLAAAGGDPMAEKRAKAEAERRKRGSTLARLADEYAKTLPHRPKMRGAGTPSPAYVAIELAQVILALAAMDAADMPAANLIVEDVRRLVAASGDGANLRARFGALNRFLDWCQDAGHIAINPCTLIARSRRPRAPQARAGHLTPEELARLWRASAGLREPVYRDLARFLMAIPCRRGEAARMEWSHLDLAAAEWRQPGHMTKNRDPHRLHLHPLAIEVLRARHRTLAEEKVGGDSRQIDRVMQAGWSRSGLVFAAPRSGRPIDTFSGIKEALVEASKAEGAEACDNWIWHDFRRSFATALGEAGIPEAVADAILNHRQAATRGGVLGVYQRASRWPEQVRAMELWGRLLTAAIDGREPGAEVVQLQVRAG